MYELRYYFNAKQYEVVDSYPTASLAYGMRKKKAKEPQYSLDKLKVVEIQSMQLKTTL